MATLSRPLFLYDADCRFCRATARFVAKLDGAGRIAFLPMHDDLAEPFVQLVPEAERFKSFHVIEPDGTAHSRGAAVIAMLFALRVTSLLGRVLKLLHLSILMDLIYLGVAGSRTFLGRFVRDAPGPIRWP